MTENAFIGRAFRETKRPPQQPPYIPSFAVLQTQIPREANEEGQYEVDNVHRVLFFNLIVGRATGAGVLTIRDSGVDQDGKVWEVNNLFCGGAIGKDSLDNHWLYGSKGWDTPISDALLEHILQLKAETGIDSVKNRVTQEGFETDSKFQTINNNLVRVQNSIQQLRSNSQPVTFQALMSSLEEKPLSSQ